MYNIHTARRNAAAAAAAADAAERGSIGGGATTPARAARLIKSVYGKSQDELAQAREDRVGDWVDTTIQDGLPESALPQAGGTGYYSFRDRAQLQELGNSYVSATRLVPRMAFRGGGARQEDRAASGEDGRRTVLEPRPVDVKPHVLYSSSSCDAMPRIKQMPFNAKTRNPLERTRCKAQELGG